MVEDNLNDWADAVGAELRSIRRLSRQFFAVDLAQARLTAAQVGLLSALAAEDGQSLRALSERLQLSHSTVSGIVDRLTRRGLVERRGDPADRRVSRVFFTAPVTAYTEHTLPARQHGAMQRLARRATPEERATIRAGLTLLHALLDAETGGQTKVTSGDQEPDEQDRGERS